MSLLEVRQAIRVDLESKVARLKLTSTGDAAKVTSDHEPGRCGLAQVNPEGAHLFAYGANDGGAASGCCQRRLRQTRIDLQRPLL